MKLPSEYQVPKNWNWKFCFMNIGWSHDIEGRMLFFSRGSSFLWAHLNKAEDMFHTIFYVNNQFSLKLTVKLIEVILNYNFKVQMRGDEISHFLKIVLSAPSQCFSILQSVLQLYLILNESNLNFVSGPGAVLIIFRLH